MPMDKISKSPIEESGSSQGDEPHINDNSHLKFFLERSSETIERTLTIVRNLQQEINQLKEGISKTDSAFRNLGKSEKDDPKH